MNLPLVTVICSCFNHQSYLEEALNSVLLQTYPNIQMMVIDDASTDNSWEIIQNFKIKHPKVEIYQNPTNFGITKSFNNHFSKVNGKYYMDFATDDALLSNAIEVLVYELEKQPKDVGFIFGNAYVIDENGSLLYPYYTDGNKPFSGNIHRALLENDIQMNSSTALYKTSVFIQMNGYNVNYLFEDLDFWLKASYHFEIVYLDEFIIRRRKLEQSLGMNLFRFKGSYGRKIQKQEFEIYQKWILNNNNLDFKKLKFHLYQKIKKNIKIHNYTNAFRWSFLLIKKMI